MTEPDYSTWLTKQQAAEAIGVTTKTVERLAQDRQIQQARWRRPTGGPELAVYHPDDVARIARERRPGLAPFVLPVGAEVPANGNGHQSSTALARVSDASIKNIDGEDLLRVLVAAAARVMSETSQTPTLFLTIEEAAAVSGLSCNYLRKVIKSGTLPAVRNHGWRIRRKDLEQL